MLVFHPNELNQTLGIETGHLYFLNAVLLILMCRTENLCVTVQFSKKTTDVNTAYMAWPCTVTYKEPLLINYYKS